MNKFRAFLAGFIVLILAVGILIVGYVGRYNAATNYATQLEGVYERSFYELINNVNNIEVGLSKTLISTDTNNLYKLFDDIYDDCVTASSNLSRLPINQQSISETTKFVNQLGGFSYYICKKITNNETLTNDDYASMSDLYDMSVYIQSTINDFANNLGDSYRIIDNVEQDNIETEFDSMFSNMQDGTVDYPTLIYDGPFSASTTDQTIKGLPETQITKSEAEQKVRNIFKDENISNLTYEGLTTGKFETFNFDFKTQDNRTVYVQITKRGGMLLTISSYENANGNNYTLAECEDIAEKFALSVGLENLQSVWGTKLSGIAYINLTTVVDDVIVYPEMIKVKISCATGNVLGWEAQAYAYNHNERTNLTATIGATVARAKVSTKLNILSQKLTIIPQEYGEDVLAYEFKCNFNNYIYYVYIDAKTGVEVQVLRVVNTTDGDLLM